MDKEIGEIANRYLNDRSFKKYSNKHPENLFCFLLTQSEALKKKSHISKKKNGEREKFKARHVSIT